MFWKLLLMAAVIFFVVGKTPALQHPLVRLFLPRSWAMALSLIPDRRTASAQRQRPREAREVAARDAPAPSSPVTSGSTREARRAWTGRKGRIVLFALFLVLISAWLATRAMYSMDAGGVPTPPEP